MTSPALMPAATNGTSARLPAETARAVAKGQGFVRWSGKDYCPRCWKLKREALLAKRKKHEDGDSDP